MDAKRKQIEQVFKKWYSLGNATWEYRGAPGRDGKWGGSFHYIGDVEFIDDPENSDWNYIQEDYEDGASFFKVYVDMGSVEYVKDAMSELRSMLQKVGAEVVDYKGSPAGRVFYIKTKSESEEPTYLDLIGEVKKIISEQSNNEYSDEKEDEAQKKEANDEGVLRIEAEELLESIEDHLREAIESVEDFIDITKKFDIRLSEEARLYILGHLRAFKDDQSQMGSVKSLYNGLTEKEEE